MKQGHKNDFLRNILLLLRGLLQIAGFLGMWTGCVFWGASWAQVIFWTGAALCLYCFFVHLVLPVFRLFR